MSSRAHTAPAYRLKPAPRRRSGGGPTSRIRWDRLGRVALVLVLALIMLSYIRPVTNLFEGWTESKAEQERLQQLKVENQDLKAQTESLKSSNAAIVEARQLGMVSEGETPYVVRGLGR